MKDEEWDDVIAVNLTSVFVLTRGILRGMMRRALRAHRQYRLDLRRARQSGAGELCRLEGGARWHDEIACAGGVEPGHYRQLHRAWLHLDADDRRADAETGRGNRRGIPAEKFGKPEDVAAAVVFLASDEAGYVTGETMHINGGMVMV